MSNWKIGERLVFGLTSFGFEPTNPYSEISDHDYLELYLQAGRLVICLQWYFFPVSRWSFEECSIELYSDWLKADLPTLWFRADMSIFPKHILKRK